MTLVVLNGERQELPDGATVEVAVTATGAPAEGRGVAVALDGQVVPRGEWSTTPVREGQEVEVVHAVQGGA
jgi:sulfur carrier protein